MMKNSNTNQYVYGAYSKIKKTQQQMLHIKLKCLGGLQRK